MSGDGDPEHKALQACVQALEPLLAPERARVLMYLALRFIAADSGIVSMLRRALQAGVFDA